VYKSRGDATAGGIRGSVVSSARVHVAETLVGRVDGRASPVGAEGRIGIASLISSSSPVDPNSAPCETDLIIIEKIDYSTTPRSAITRLGMQQANTALVPRSDPEFQNPTSLTATVALFGRAMCWTRLSICEPELRTGQLISP